MKSFNITGKQAIAAGLVVGLVLGGQEIFRALNASAIAAGGDWAAAAIVVTSGLVASSLTSLLLWIISTRSAERGLVGEWSLRLGNTSGDLYRSARVSIRYDKLRLRLQGENVDTETGSNSSYWNSTAAWVVDDQLFFLYDLQQTTNNPLKKSGFMVLNTADVRRSGRMVGSWFDYQPAGRQGHAIWEKTDRSSRPA